MYFIIGFCGALTCLGVFGLGVVIGWNVYLRVHNSADALPAPQGQAVRDEQDAFRRLQNYSAEDAYGLNQEENA
ncbi:MAG: hypothetical protein IJK52_00435 [Oscillospiraceae bacterium]|nr:hypothetical protein [Oscillospiraceae bacterium]